MKTHSFPTKRAAATAPTKLSVAVTPLPANPDLGPCRFVSSSHKLGNGAYGSVLLGTDLCTSLPVAIKFIAEGRMRPASLEREVLMLRRLSEANHPALIKFHAHVRPAEIANGEVKANGALPLSKTLSQYHALVMEVARGGELFDHVVKHDGLDERESAPICAQLCDAVRAAHSLGIAHRDLKLENVLLVGRGEERSDMRRIKLIDWGLAHQHALNPDGSVIHEKLHSRCGSRSYMAPEVTNREISSVKGYNGFAADVWSLGVCLFAIHLGFFPFEQADPEQDWRARRVVAAQKEGRSTMATILTFYPSRPTHLSTPLLQLLDRMLLFDPKRRASLTEVLSAEWLAPHVPACCPMQLNLASTRVNTTVTASRASDSSIGTNLSVEGGFGGGTPTGGGGHHGHHGGHHGGHGGGHGGGGGSVALAPSAARQDSARSTSNTSVCSSGTTCSSSVLTNKPLERPRRFVAPPAHMPPKVSPHFEASRRAATAGSTRPPPTRMSAMAEEQPPSPSMPNPPTPASPKPPPPSPKPQRARPHDEHPGGSTRDFLTELFAKKCKLARSRSARSPDARSCRTSSAMSSGRESLGGGGGGGGGGGYPSVDRSSSRRSSGLVTASHV